MSSLQILETNPLSVTSFANIFSQSVGCLFIQFIAFFAICDAFLKENIRLHLINKVLLYFFKTIHKTYESMREREGERQKQKERETEKEKRREQL